MKKDNKKYSFLFFYWENCVSSQHIKWRLNNWSRFWEFTLNFRRFCSLGSFLLCVLIINIWLFEWAELFKTKQISWVFLKLWWKPNSNCYFRLVYLDYIVRNSFDYHQTGFFFQIIWWCIFSLKFWTFSDFRPLLFSMFSTSYILFHIKHFSIFFVDKKHIRYLLLLSIKKNSPISIKCHQW